VLECRSHREAFALDRDEGGVESVDAGAGHAADGEARR
jgi:hypothetical protein